MSISNDLRQAVLQAAIQGKLTKQLPEDGNAKDLLEQIKAEKAKIIKEGKLKKEKPLPEITEDEKPFDVPENWEWCRLREIGVTLTGNTPSTTRLEYYNGDIPFVGPGDISTDSEINYDTTKKLTVIGSEMARLVENETLLQVCIGGSIGKVCLVERTVAFNQQINALAPIKMLPKFAFYVMKSQMFLDGMLEKSTGTATPIINRTAWEQLLIPIPPLSEQKRIVAKVEELMAKINELEKSEQELEALKKAFPADMKASLLQAAMQGKLTKQLPEDGNAKDLLEQIKAEKAMLIKEGKLKKEKPLPEITEDEKPFDVPENWEWCRINDIGFYRKGPFGSALTKSMFVPKGDDTVKVYEQKNAIQKDASLGEYFITREYYEKKMTAFTVYPKDIIVSCAGTIGETYIMPESIELGIINQALMRMKLVECIDVKYFLAFFDHIIKEKASKSSKGSAIKNIPPFEIFKSMVVPIPPLAEQKRIVEKLEKLLPLCDGLK